MFKPDEIISLFPKSKFMSDTQKFSDSLSGNNLVDAHEKEQDDEAKAKGKLECGCKRGNCRCDSGWDEGED